MRTVRQHRLIDAIMPRNRQGILAALLLNPEQTWYLSDLARHLKVPRSSLQREIGALAAVGIIKTRREGRMIYYQADAENPVFPDLQGLFAKTAGLADVLRDALHPVHNRVHFSFVYGSIARNEETPISDIDLLIVGDIGLKDISAAVRHTQERLGREVNPKVYRPGEFAKRVGARDHFLLSVLQKPKLFVIGTKRELDEAIEGKAGDARAD